MACQPLALDKGEHVFVWNKEASGIFTTAYAFDADANPRNHKDEIFKIVWKWLGPKRVRAFLWTLATKCLLTNYFRCQRRLSYNNLCPRCDVNEENAIHLLRDCPFSILIWRMLGADQANKNFFQLPWNRWIIQNLKDTKVARGRCWKILFGIATHVILFQRNEKIFKQNTLDVLQAIMRIIRTNNQIENVER